MYLRGVDRKDRESHHVGTNVAETFLVLSLSKDGLQNFRWKAEAFRYTYLENDSRMVC